MTPLKALVGLVALLFDAFFGKKTGAWPDGEQPLIDPPQDYPSDWELMWTGEEVSAGSAIEARVDAPADEVPTPGRDHTPGVGRLPCAHPFGYDHPCARCGHSGGNIHLRSSAIGPLDCSCDEQTDAYLYYPRHHPACISQLPEVTAGLLIAASIGLRDYADSDACEAPVYWRSIASQLDPKATR